MSIRPSEYYLSLSLHSADLFRQTMIDEEQRVECGWINLSRFHVICYLFVSSMTKCVAVSVTFKRILMASNLSISLFPTTRSKRQANTPLPRPLVPGDEGYVRMAHDTIEELDWCLDQLETIQTHRSVSDMASLKVRTLACLSILVDFLSAYHGGVPRELRFNILSLLHFTVQKDAQQRTVAL